jgi:hypothetical protein
MKNIHLIPTHKSSRIYTNNGTLHLDKYSSASNGITINQHIYITSDEEIKEGNWYLEEKSKFNPRKLISEAWGDGQHFKTFNQKGFRKIILTTDTDLIADGVQAIEDSFLEWFVKNPSCEEVEVKKGKMKLNDDGEEYGFPDMSLYKIIIPKEPKQEMPIVNGIHGCTIQTKRRETIEEAAEKYNSIKIAREAFIAGAKEQAERMYSELELFINEVKDKIDSFEYSVNQKSYISEYLDEWFEQFKKK